MHCILRRGPRAPAHTHDPASEFILKPFTQIGWNAAMCKHKLTKSYERLLIPGIAISQDNSGVFDIQRHELVSSKTLRNKVAKESLYSGQVHSSNCATRHTLLSCSSHPFVDKTHMATPLVYVITGASRGIGAEFVKQVHGICSAKCPHSQSAQTFTRALALTLRTLNRRRCRSRGPL